jgi:hypothetical protein
MVSTLDSESNNPSSNLGRTFFYFSFIFLLPLNSSYSIGLISQQYFMAVVDGFNFDVS